MNTSYSCIPRILRRILCFGTLSSSSLDRFQAEEKDDSVVDDGLSTPGIVARLMGLESLPKAERIEQRDSRSSQRSDFPVYQDLEDEHFFILSFESRKKSKRRESLRRMDKENDDANMVYNRDSDFDVRKKKSQRSVLSPVENSCQMPRKQRMKLRLQEEESENSSPNSVLECSEFPSEHEETASSSGEFSTLMNTKLRRMLSKELHNRGKKSDEKQRFNNGCGAQEKMGRKLKNREWNYDEYWDQMGRLATRESLKSNWVDHEISVEDQDYGEEICRDVASELLDLLLDELMLILCLCFSETQV